jgi:hypothetical protein
MHKESFKHISLTNISKVGKVNISIKFLLLTFFGGRWEGLFWAQMALASLVSFQGPKKSRFSGPNPSNAPRNDVALLKTITYRAIKTTGTLLVITTFSRDLKSA